MDTVLPHSLFTAQDVYLFREGRHYRLYEKFGAHSMHIAEEPGTYFAVWAPNAVQVSVIGNFNGWHSEKHILYPRWDNSGIWEGFIPGLAWGEVYKYAIRTQENVLLEKGDPFALSWEQQVQAASVISTTWYEWKDHDWMAERASKNSLSAPLAVYEMHLGSWMRGTDNPQRFFSYREIAERLVPYLQAMNFTHVEFMPVMEFPFDPSWGYQITGFYAATSRFGPPQDLMYLIEQLHLHGIGVFLDWVPSHFPGDANGLHFFDGSYLYEHADPRRNFHPEWKSHLFNYGRPEVRSFLISNAIFWLDRYHADGLRVDAVTSMLHLDYARREGEWEPNSEGGNVDLEAKAFLQEFNTAVYQNFPDVLTIAEESSDFPRLTKPVYSGGVGFGMKWMMGWMHDTLDYFETPVEARKKLHHKLTFASMYMYNENYMMPLSHDEVVHGKSSLIYKMPGDEWQKFANLRALLTYMYTMPGGKLLFMGNEFGQTGEWDFASSLQWHLLQYPIHRGLQTFVKTLNTLYRTETALYQNQFHPEGFEWLEADDMANSVYAYLRKGKKAGDEIMTVLNLTPGVYTYRITVPAGSFWDVLLSSDEAQFGGSGSPVHINYSETASEHSHTVLEITLPPLAGLLLHKQRAAQKSISAEEDDNMRISQSVDAREKTPASNEKVAKKTG